MMIPILYYLAYILLTFFSLLLIFLLLFYDWRNLSFRRKYKMLPAPKQNVIFGLGLELARLEPKEPIFGCRIWWRDTSSIKWRLRPLLINSRNKIQSLCEMEILWYAAAKIRSIGDMGCVEILGNPLVFLMSPEDIEVLFSSSQYITKGAEYHNLTPWLRDGLLTSTGEKWQFRRKLLTPTFHFKILERFLPIFNRNAQILTEDLMNTCADSSKPIDVGPLIYMCTLTIICETTMGISLDFQSDEGLKYVKAIHSAAEIVVKRVLTFWMRRDWVFNNSPTGREFKKVVEHIHKFTGKVIRDRKEKYKSSVLTRNNSSDSCNSVYKQRVSFLDRLIEFQRNNPELMTDDDIHEEVDTFMFEGYDTVGTTIVWSLFMIASHPNVQEKLQQEIQDIFGDSLRDITLQDINEMQYLDMVLKETLRLYPAVPFLSRIIPVDLKTKDQHIIPAGMNVAVLPHLVHRDPRIYPDPEKFDPDRFSPNMAKKRHPYAYIPFSAGFRNCIGQKFANLEAKITIATILRRLNTTTTLKKSDVIPVPHVVLRPSSPITLSFSQICRN